MLLQHDVLFSPFRIHQPFRTWFGHLFSNQMQGLGGWQLKYFLFSPPTSWGAQIFQPGSVETTNVEGNLSRRQFHHCHALKWSRLALQWWRQMRVECKLFRQGLFCSFGTVFLLAARVWQGYIPSFWKWLGNPIALLMCSWVVFVNIHCLINRYFIYFSVSFMLADGMLMVDGWPIDVCFFMFFNIHLILISVSWWFSIRTKIQKTRINQPAFKPINQVFDISIPVSPCYSSKTMLVEATYWTIQYLHPQSLTWPLKNDGWKMSFLLGLSMGGMLDFLGVSRK